MYAKKNSNKKLIAVLLAVALLVGGAVGGTVAWLVTGTETITNTFTVGNITIDLTETADDGFKIVPGTSQEKDPTVTVEAGSEDCYVFVKIIDNKTVVNGITYVDWAVDGEWEALESVPGVYYQEYTAVGNENQDKTYPVLEDNVVSYPSELTKANLDALTEAPSLKFTAYADQMANGSEKFAPEAAWALTNAN